MNDVTLEAHAKVNLFLRVLSKEASGYHGIETLFCRISLADSLTVGQSDGRGVTLTSEGEECGPPAEAEANIGNSNVNANHLTQARPSESRPGDHCRTRRPRFLRAGH